MQVLKFASKTDKTVLSKLITRYMLWPFIAALNPFRSAQCVPDSCYTGPGSCVHGFALILLSASPYVSKRGAYYGRPLSVSGRPCYILPMFFLFYFFMAALFSGPG